MVGWSTRAAARRRVAAVRVFAVSVAAVSVAAVSVAAVSVAAVSVALVAGISCSVPFVAVAAAAEPVVAESAPPGPERAQPAPVLAPTRPEPMAPPASAGTALPRNVSPIAASELNVRDADELGHIFVDDREVGVGQYRGTLSPGRHRLRVSREGFDSFEKELELGAAEVHAETVVLRRSVDASPVPSPSRAVTMADGLYGGIQLLAAFSPGGSGSTPADACDTTGATSCTPGSVLGAGLSGYAGWFLDPLGLELSLLGAADVVQPVASFDGVTGSEINPILASPARDEEFTIGRFGVGAALRARYVHAVSRFRFTAALGPGLMYRALLMRRSTESPEGYAGEHTDTRVSYVSPMLSLELAAHMHLGASTALSLGVASWFEHAGDDAKTAQSNSTYLYRDGSAPRVAQATPEYALASGVQWLIGPFLGLQFGL